MIRQLKRLFFYISKWAGLFSLAAYMTRHGLRIICYHGFGEGDETQWLPGMFVRAETLRNHLDVLHQKGYTVLPLDEAIVSLAEGQLPPKATVITVDDGFASTKEIAQPIFQEHSYPYTVYVTSYYSIKETPIFNLAIQYMFWKTQKASVDLREIGLDMPMGAATNSVFFSRDALIQHVLQYGHSHLDISGKRQFMKRLGEYLEVDYAELLKKRTLSLLTPSEISEMAADGVDIQLHTHRHRWPMQQQEAMQEIEENRVYLEPLVGKKLNHFCYPSGQWTSKQISYLQAAGITSATTCDAGLNYPEDSLFQLHRFLDDDRISDIEFEAIISGYWGGIKRLISLLFPSKTAL